MGYTRNKTKIKNDKVNHL